MRKTVDELDVLASRTLLPADGETVELTTRRPGRTVLELPAFAEDPRRAEGVPPRLGRRIDRFTALAYKSVRELVEPLEMPEGHRVGVFFANTHAGWAYAEPQMDSMVDEGPHTVAPYFVTAWFPTAATGEVTIGLGYQGPSKTTTGRVSGFAEAMWLARDAMERQTIDVAVVGAIESVVAPFAMLNWPDDAGLPTEGPAEGAVMFAVRPRPTGAAGGDGVALADLRYEGGDRTTDADGDWIPTLSLAARLADGVDRARGAEADLDMALGAGYRVTVADRSGAAA